VEPGTNGTIYACVSRSTVYARGLFSSIGASRRVNWPPDRCREPTAWNPSANNQIKSIVVNGSNVMSGAAYQRWRAEPKPHRRPRHRPRHGHGVESVVGRRRGAIAVSG
jgi:hypothetical protein